MSIQVISFEKAKRRRKEMNGVKPIEALTEVKEEKFVKAIVKSFAGQPSEDATRKNQYALSLLKRVRRG